MVFFFLNYFYNWTEYRNKRDSNLSVIGLLGVTLNNYERNQINSCYALDFSLCRGPSCHSQGPSSKSGWPTGGCEKAALHFCCPSDWFRGGCVIRSGPTRCEKTSAEGLLESISLPTDTKHRKGHGLPLDIWDARKCRNQPGTPEGAVKDEAHTPDEEEQRAGKNLGSKWHQWATELVNLQATLPWDFTLCEVKHLLKKLNAV